MPRLLTKSEVCQLFAISKRTLDRRISEGRFPKAIDVGGPKWPEDVIVRFIKDEHAKANPMRDLRPA